MYVLFKKKYDILTIEGTKEVRLQTYTTDFELALLNSLREFLLEKEEQVVFSLYSCFD